MALSRHTFASRLVMSGADLRTVAELLRDKTLAMVMRYAHLARTTNSTPSSACATALPDSKTDTKLAPVEEAEELATGMLQ